MSGFEEFRQLYAHNLVPGSPVTDEALLNKYRGRVPDTLLEEWQISGFAGFGNGFIWLTDPSEMQYAITEWKLEPSWLIFGRTAFGDLFIWDGENVRGLFVHDGTDAWFTDDLKMFFEFSLCDDAFLEEVLRFSTFREALARLEQVDRDEMYTYVPALVLGGEDSVEHLKKVKMREQLLLLSQLHRGDVS